MFILLSLLYSVVLFLNAFVILDNRRFLSRVGLPLSTEHRQLLPPASKKVVEIISIVRALELPLIALNILFIIYELF